MGSSAAASTALDLPVALDRGAQRLAPRLVEPADQPVGGEDGQPGVLERDEAHQHVARAALLLVHAGRLVAVVAVGDQQLRGGQRGRDGGARLRVGDAPEAVDRAVLVGHLAPGRALDVRGDGAPRRPRRVVVEREDGGEVGLGRAGQPQAVLLGPGVRALVRADLARAVVLDAHAREQAVAGAPDAVGTRVVLRERPDRGLLVAHEHAVALPGGEHLGGVRVRVAVGARQVDLDDVVRRARDQLGALRVVDDVVRRSRQGLEAAGGVEVVVEGAEGLDVGHGAVRLAPHLPATAGRRRSPRCTWRRRRGWTARRSRRRCRSRGRPA